MGLLSMTDCSIAENRVQARYELDRIGEGSGVPVRDKMLAAWAEKWGRELLDNQGEVAQSEYDAVCEEATTLEALSETFGEAIDEAVRSLENIVPSEMDDEKIENLISGVIANLERVRT